MRAAVPSPSARSMREMVQPYTDAPQLYGLQCRSDARQCPRPAHRMGVVVAHALRPAVGSVCRASLFPLCVPLSPWPWTTCRGCVATVDALDDR